MQANAISIFGRFTLDFGEVFGEEGIGLRGRRGDVLSACVGAMGVRGVTMEDAAHRGERRGAAGVTPEHPRAHEGGSPPCSSRLASKMALCGI